MKANQKLHQEEVQNIRLEKILDEMKPMTAMMEAYDLLHGLPERERRLRFMAATLVLAGDMGIGEAAKQVKQMKSGNPADLVGDLATAQSAVRMAHAILLKSRENEEQALLALLDQVDPRYLLGWVTEQVEKIFHGETREEALEHLEAASELLKSV